MRASYQTFHEHLHFELHFSLKQMWKSAINIGKNPNLERAYCIKNIHLFGVSGLIHTNCGTLAKS